MFSKIDLHFRLNIIYTIQKILRLNYLNFKLYLQFLKFFNYFFYFDLKNLEYNYLKFQYFFLKFIVNLNF